MAERSARFSESGDSRDLEEGADDGADDAVRAMLGAQEYHQVSNMQKDDPFQVTSWFLVI